MDQELDAQEALRSAQEMRARVARRAATPAWYGPLYALACAGLVTSGALPQPWGGVGTAISVLAVVLLYRFWQDSTGLSVNGYRAGRTRTIAIALALVFVALIGFGVVLRSEYGLAWAPFACGAAAFLAAYFGNNAWDRAWRAQMAGPC